MLGCNELGPEGEEAEQARQSLLAVRSSAALGYGSRGIT